MDEAIKQAKNGVVVGMAALTGDSTPRVRTDIDIMLRDQPDAFNLFLLALVKIQKDPSIIGFFGLSSIHGLPSTTWDDVLRKIIDNVGGYCAHGVLAFPAWHRPYLALVEQTLYLAMLDIINNDFAEEHRAKYLEAAKAFRLPYFDYFRPRGDAVIFPGRKNDNLTTDFPYDFTLPTVVDEKKIIVRTAPDDQEDEIDNPLYAYHFTQESGQFEGNDLKKVAALYNTNYTVRHPDDINSTDHDLVDLSNTLNNGREARCSYSLDLLNSPAYMSVWQITTDNRRQTGNLFNVDLTIPLKNSKGQVVESSGSIEGLHNKYHGLIGGTGVMRDPRVAAMDPIFYLHHCNIDRYWSLWQLLHPDQWFPNPPPGQQTPSENDKPLYPFYKSKVKAGEGDFWTIDQTRKTETFGYIYDDAVNFDGDTTALWEAYRKRYIWQIRLPNNPDFNKIPEEMKPIDYYSTRFSARNWTKPTTVLGSFAQAAQAVVAPVMQTFSMQATSSVMLQEPAPLVLPVQRKFNREWYVDTDVKRSAANGTFAIYFFLAAKGELSDDPNTYMTSPYLAAINYIFASPRETCDNCGKQDAAGQLASDTSPITPLLLDYLERTDNNLETLEPENVRPFLIKNLRWRVVYFGSQDKDPRAIPQFNIGVSAKKYSDDGQDVDYEDYADIVETIKQNASATAGAHASA